MRPTIRLSVERLEERDTPAVGVFNVAETAGLAPSDPAMKVMVSPQPTPPGLVAVTRAIGPQVGLTPPVPGPVWLMPNDPSVKVIAGPQPEPP